MRPLRRVAVLGAGTMGSRIAAHFANAGVSVLLLDITAEAAARGLEAAAKSRAFYTDASRTLVTTGSFDERLPDIAECDWVLEAIVEKLEPKRALLRRVEPLLARGAIVSTNTSGIPLRQISEGFSPAFRRSFLGTHFFNPPRYLHLLELIPGPETDPALLAAVAHFADVRLGKGVVLCKDTPNFIGNRLGAFFSSTATKIMVEDGYSIEEVEALTGPLIGLPSSASFRLLDIIGLDIWADLLTNLRDGVPRDPWRERFTSPAFMTQMIERGWLGDKSSQGFFKRVGPSREIHALDWRTLEYHPAGKPCFPAADEAGRITDLAQRLRALVSAGDRAGAFVWRLLSDYMLYAAERIPEISDRVVEIDRAMRWGYAHTFGPFELWDALGFEETAARIENEGRTLPESIMRMRAAGAASFYAGDRYFDLVTGEYRQLESQPGVVRLEQLPHVAGSERLRDAGDGVLVAEAHNLDQVEAALERARGQSHALVLTSLSDRFEAGTDPGSLLNLAEAGERDEITRRVERLQRICDGIRRSPVPVVCAVSGRVTGAGLSLALACAAMQAAAETYLGFGPEAAGLIPIGGWWTEALRRRGHESWSQLLDCGWMSGSALEARERGLLREGDRITMNPDRLLGDARALALECAARYNVERALLFELLGDQGARERIRAAATAGRGRRS